MVWFGLMLICDIVAEVMGNRIAVTKFGSEREMGE